MSDIESEPVQVEDEAALVEQEIAAAADLPVVYQIEVGPEDVILRTMAGNVLSEGLIEVDQETHDAAMVAILQHGAWFRDGEVVPMPAPPLPPIVLSAEVLFFERMTDAEYDDLDASVRAGESARIYRGWAAATSFTEGTDMWALLMRHLDLVVTNTRRADLLARP